MGELLINYEMTNNDISIKFENVNISSLDEENCLIGSFKPVMNDSHQMNIIETIRNYIIFVQNLHQVFMDENYLWDLANESLIGLAYYKVALKYSSEDDYGTQIPPEKIILECLIKLIEKICKLNKEELPLYEKCLKELKTYLND